MYATLPRCILQSLETQCTRGATLVQDEAVQNLFIKYAANICFLSWVGSPFTMAIYSKDTVQGRLGMFMRESTRTSCFPGMQPPA